ncbi:MAG: DUF3135 domain-containing protein [Pseudomonadales bacterium]|nr:DUF3135 domain-containing protein [Pseudomonadales bacterium]
MKYELPDFDTLVALSKTNPEALLKIKTEASQSLIDAAPMHCKRRLAGLQFQIDMETRRAKSPMDSCIRVSKMMHQTLGELRSTLQGAIAENFEPAVEDLSQNSATVLPFRNFS